jgi:hypothetical protein
MPLQRLQGSENQPGCSLLRVPRSHATIQPLQIASTPHRRRLLVFSSPSRVASARHLSAVDRLAARLYCEQTPCTYKHNVPPLAPPVRPGIACPDPQMRHDLVWPGSTSQSVPFFGGSTDVWRRRTGTSRVETPGLLAETAHKNSPISTPSRSPDAQMQLPTCSIHRVFSTPMCSGKPGLLWPPLIALITLIRLD